MRIFYNTKHAVLSMAVSGHNGNNETQVGLSNSIGLSFFDATGTEMQIAQSSSPIDMIIQRDKKTVDIAFQYINATSLGFLPKSFLMQHSFKIKMINASLRIELKSVNASVAYLVILKLGYMPIVNSTAADFTSFKIMCPSKSQNNVFFFFTLVSLILFNGFNICVKKIKYRLRVLILKISPNSEISLFAEKNSFSLIYMLNKN